MEEKTYSVSESVRLVGVESHVLRYWEEELHVPIQRNAQGHRIYSRENITLFQKVKDWKEKGLQLKAIRVLLERAEGLEMTGDETFEQQVSETFAEHISSCNIEGDSCVGEIVPTARVNAGSSIDRITEIFRQIVREAAEEQNERLEQMLTNQLREEARDLYLQYFQMIKAAAVSREEAECGSGEAVHRGKIRRIWEILFGERI